MKNKRKKNSKQQIKKLSFQILKYGFIFGGSIILLLVLLVRIGVFGRLPSEAEIKQVKNNTATEVISVDNMLLGRYYYQNRTNAAYSEIPKDFIDALIATEDVRFYKHNGVDTRSTLRVLVKSILLFNKGAGGGSTITQQLAKNLYPRRNYSFLTLPVAKIKEITIAKRLEKVYSKKEILVLYLNTVSFGENTYGIETASIIFFSKKPSKLKIEEAAMLVGLLKANTNYNPRTNPEAALKRRNVVLGQMEKYGYLKAEQADSLKNTPLKLKHRKLTQNEGPAPYMREHLRHEAKKILEDYKKADGTPYNLYADGLKIYVTINHTMQTYVEEAVKEHLSDLQKKFDAQWKDREPWKKNINLAKQQIKQSKVYQSLIQSGKSHQEAIEEMKKKHRTTVFDWDGDKVVEMSSLDSILHHFQTLQTGALVMNGFNGDVLAWVGGSGYKYFKYDHIKSKRQVGSTFKPIVYASAVEAGRDPCKYYANDSIVYTDYDDWTPSNSDGKYGGYYSMKGALAKSVNTVSVKVLLQNGMDSTIQLARKMGIESDLPKLPSIALGTAEASLYEMVQCYCTFLNRGKRVNPRLIRRIEDSKGKVIYTNPAHEPGEQVISPETAQTMIAMMQGTVDRGTASSLRSRYNLRSELAGKTGTTQKQTDGWFIGMNPNLVVGVWVGGDNPAVRFRSITYGQGSYSALPVYAKFFQKLYNDPTYKYLSSASFNIPQNIYNKIQCEDFREDETDLFFDLFKIEDKGINKFIRNVFKRKNNKRRNHENFEEDTNQD